MDLDWGALMDCGDWWRAPGGSARGAVAECPRHGPVAMVRPNVERPWGWFGTVDWAWRP